MDAKDPDKMTDAQILALPREQAIKLLMKIDGFGPIEAGAALEMISGGDRQIVHVD